MCGRITLRTPATAWFQQTFEQFAGHDPESASARGDSPAGLDSPRYNIAPSQSVAAIVRRDVGAPATLVGLRWGLIPAWATTASVATKTINARSETADQKASFKHSFARQRCLILADGYYEWKKTADGKQPYLFHRSDHQVFLLAGLWATNDKVAADGPGAAIAETPRPAVQTCTVLTQPANDAVSFVHHRMPVVLEQSEWDAWLDPGLCDRDVVRRLVKPVQDSFFRYTMVSQYVNSATRDDPGCMQPSAIQELDFGDDD